MTISFERGGRRDAITSLSRGLRRRGSASFLATLRGDRDEMDRFAEHFDGTHRLGISGLPSIANLKAVRDHCRANAIDIVHAHDAASQFVASALRFVSPLQRSIMTFHRSLSMESAGLRNKLRNAVSLTMTDRVLTASEERRHHFIAENWYPEKRVAVVPLGIDADRFRPDPATRNAVRDELGVEADTPVIVAMGHYGSEKGVDLVINAFQSISREMSTGQPILAILGTGRPDTVAAIERLAREVGGGRIRLLGQRPDPERWLAGADLMLHLPRIEAFGLAVVQGMATELPVVASKVGGIPDLITSGTTGYLVNPANPAEVVTRCTALLGDQDLRRTIGGNARRDVLDRFTIERYAERQMAVYREVLGWQH